MTLITGFGADKTMTAVISGEADIGFMGAEASIYAYQEGATDPVVNFAQLTQRAGNFLVAREEMPDFKWEDLKGRKVLGGRKGGMPEMVFEYILKKNGLDPEKDLSIDRDYIVLVCDPAAQFMQIILSLVSYFFMAPGNFLFLPHIIAAFFYTSRQFTLLPCQPFFISSEESCFFKFNLF